MKNPNGDIELSQKWITYASHNKHTNQDITVGIDKNHHTHTKGIDYLVQLSKTDFLLPF